MYNDINPYAAVEVLEVVKYLDKSIEIDYELLEKIKEAKDDTYVFNIDKNIPLYDNEFMDETIDLLEKLVK